MPMDSEVSGSTRLNGALSIPSFPNFVGLWAGANPK